MNKKLIVVLMATLFATLFVFPAFAEVMSVSLDTPYTAGYTILNYNYFYTTNLTKPDYYVWSSAKDVNTETYYVDDYGNEYNGKHYTTVYSGTTKITEQKIVYFGSTVTFSSFYNNYAVSENSIRLRISNGNSLGLGYKTKGTFKASRSDQPIQ